MKFGMLLVFWVDRRCNEPIGMIDEYYSVVHGKSCEIASLNYGKT